MLDFIRNAMRGRTGADAHDIILTGVPRSGTTLTCHLLGQLPDVVALHEPGPMKRADAMGDRKAFRRAVVDFFAKTRRDVLRTGAAVSKHSGGKVPDNPWGGRSAGGAVRERLVTAGEIKIDKELSPDFWLCVKYPVPFTVLLEDLMPVFRCFAVVRNPLSVLSSWRSLDLPVSRGRATVAERLDRRLAQGLEALPDLLDKQIFLLSWFFEKYRLLPAASVIRYEEVVSSGGRCLGVVVPGAGALRQSLESKNKNALYDKDDLKRVGEKLLESDGAFWDFYTKDSVRALMNG